MKNNKYYPPNKTGLTRKCDPKGCGNFGANRGSRKHMGIDFVTKLNDPIFSPVDGKITRYPFASSDQIHKGIEIVNSNETHQIFYIKPIAKIGTYVKKGQLIAYADDITQKYGNQMTNHVHHEVEVNNKHIDITHLYTVKLT